MSESIESMPILLLYVQYSPFSMFGEFTEVYAQYINECKKHLPLLISFQNLGVAYLPVFMAS